MIDCLTGVHPSKLKAESGAHARTCEHPASAVLPADLPQPHIVFEEEVEVLPRHVHVQVGALAAVLFQRGTAPRERESVHLRHPCDSAGTWAQINGAQGVGVSNEPQWL